MVRPAMSSASRCIASRRSTGPSRAASSAAIASSVAASMCGTSMAMARGAKAGASVRRWFFQARPSIAGVPLAADRPHTRNAAGVR